MSNWATAILTFDVSRQDMSSDEINGLISRNDRVKKWWNYIPGVYILRISCAPFELSPDFSAINSFLICQVDPFSFSGRLSKKAWDRLFSDLLKDQEEPILDSIKNRRGSLPYEAKE